jgi:hypothetical protein
MTALRKILTADNLRKRHVIIVYRCCMYKRCKKIVDHLLLHRKVAKDLWVSVFRLGIERGRAQMCSGVIGLLERTMLKPLQFRSVEFDSSVLNVTHFERTQHLKL